MGEFVEGFLKHAGQLIQLLSNPSLFQIALTFLLNLVAQASLEISVTILQSLLKYHMLLRKLDLKRLASSC